MTDEIKELEPQEGSTEPEGEEVESGKMTFLEHLDELRKRLLRIVTYIGVGFLACFYFSPQIYHFISMPILKALPAGTRLAYTNPTDPFTNYMKVGFIAAIFLTVPLSLYEVWKFIAPGLYRKEKKYVLPFMSASIFLFLLGGAFCYYIVLPQAYGFLINLGKDFMPVIRIDEYLDLTNTMLLGFGLVFEMPVIVAFLSLFGLVTAKFLWRSFRYAVVIIVAVAAVLSPTGDAFNLLIWAAPMVMLYILSIGVAALFGWRRKVKGLD
jgi:sec-independent protein translocase protein TatC